MIRRSVTGAPTAAACPPHSAPQKAVNDLGLGLRITETNSATDGGKEGLSEVFGAALWTADVALEFARAGATGVHMHWGFGGDPRTGGPAYVGVMTQYKRGDEADPYPSIHAPWCEGGRGALQRGGRAVRRTRISRRTGRAPR